MFLLFQHCIDSLIKTRKVWITCLLAQIRACIPPKAGVELYVGASSVMETFSNRSYIVWDTTPCSPLKVIRRFGTTYLLHLLGWRVNEVRNQHEAGSEQSSCSNKGFFRITAYFPIFPSSHPVILFTGMLAVIAFTRSPPASRVFLLGLLFEPEDRGDMFLRTAGWLSSDYAALYPRRHNSS
jgi:hypothetical protein